MWWRVCHGRSRAPTISDASRPWRRRRKRLVLGDDGHLLSEGREASTDH